MTPVVFPSACGERPVRLSAETRLFAFESLNRKYGLDTRKTMAVSIDDMEGFDRLPPLEQYDVALRRVAEQAPIRICDGEKLSGAATLGHPTSAEQMPISYHGNYLVAACSHLTLDFGTVVRHGMKSIRRRAEAALEIHKQAAAVVEAWYPGEQGGNALADLLYGRTVPSGRLCASFPMRTADLPPFDDYEREHGRTYMYCKIPPLYPFGFGLSYTRFSYSALTVDGDDITFTIRNTGSCAGDEVWQLYLDSAVLAHQPKLRLVRFGRVRLAAGEEVQIAVSLDARCFALYDWNGKEFAAHGGFTLYAGGCLPDDRSKALGATSDWVSASFSR